MSSADTYFGIFAVIVTTAMFLYHWSVKTFDYWKERKVPYVKPVPLFGNLWPFVRKKENYCETVERIYKCLEGHRFGGYFEMREPILMIRDPELVTLVTIKDFQHFHDRSLEFAINPSDKTLNPLSSHLFGLKGEKWRTLRQKLSSVFTANRLIGMYDHIRECVSDLNKFLESKCSSPGIEMKDVFISYMIDVIGCCTFGVSCKSLLNEQSQFAEMSKTAILEPKYALKFLLLTIHPKLLNILRIADLPRDASDFFTKLIFDAITLRSEQKEKRNDYLQMLIDLMNKDETSNANVSCEFDKYDLASNAFIFLIAGFETTATTLSFTLHELAVHPHIQQKLRMEIEHIKSKYGGKLTLESLKDFVYMEMVICETLRKHPPVSVLFRICTKDYMIPGTDVIIEEGTKVFVPTKPLHYDPKYFPDPEKFDPERFCPENKAERPSGCYVPFGEGPRYCIGVRFAQVAMKLALAEMISNYKFVVCDKTDLSLELAKGLPVLLPKSGFWLKVIKL